MQSKNDHLTEVMVTGNRCSNDLGVIRGLGRRGVPIILLDFDRGSMTRYSKYISKKLACPDPKKSEIRFINFLLDVGKQRDKKCMIIPIGDAEVMALSKHKEELERFYLLPLPSFEVIQKLVNKKEFYKLLDQMSIPHPKTYFPEDISELKSIGREIDYPYIIKPAYSHLFGKKFHTKVFVINSPQELDQAAEKLRNTNIEVVIQEIIPGKDIYMFYSYFNNKCEPIAISGYDKLRQYPPDFGGGSLCKSAWRSVPIDSAIQVLRAIRYHGIAEPEFKRDPRDGKYKLLEINARTSTENRLPARCGVDVEYIAYLDTLEQYMEDQISPNNEILWMDEINDLLSCLMQLKEGGLGIREIFESLRGKKEYAIFARDDSLPFFIYLFNFSSDVLRFLLRRSRSYVKSMMGR